MSDEKFLIKYEELLNKDYCNCNEMNCLDNNSPRRMLNIAKKLQQENQQLNEDIKVLFKENCNKEKVIKRYEDNWNKLKEYIGQEWYSYDNDSVEFEVSKDILNKIHELESRRK